MSCVPAPPPAPRPSAGDVVRQADGKLGIITAPIPQAGPFKGMVSVMWAFANYEVLEQPEGLTIIDPAAVRAFASTAP